MADNLGRIADSQNLERAGDHAVDSLVTCVITRFGLRSPIDLATTYRDYRRTIEQARETPGLIRAAFLVENARTCYSLSIWSSADRIPGLAAEAPYHVTAARRTLGRLESRPLDGRQLWSTKWRLASVSNNLNWEGLDLREHIAPSRVRLESGGA